MMKVIKAGVLVLALATCSTPCPAETPDEWIALGARVHGAFLHFNLLRDAPGPAYALQAFGINKSVADCGLCRPRGKKQPRAQRKG
jgi:hypothetical protein